ncbi:putative PurR-regulated permease PerM [Breznakia sp. PF5-3]|uniref:AI-2E family transporter n=1 Tax=unclassified Breznakia TaxID=2623764 RepID=UPI00240507C7|nr:MULTISPECIES: AI-2E family transporter [unclassified Breznakia]MDF9823745.1 putative PurR-regulated permease PerM [Breznakia sp. PM6-1]MDF9834543.1 putative PurR-regulated permease PerM [Breznakia sp. PF5-3]MDF9838701.1 putative PurR-regulated permease PerM [Breznakia sp. PFB2-8]MDF9860732.1 putative PurR-regulated permease PerM [Breznakia sp. PH5-24]
MKLNLSQETKTRVLTGALIALIAIVIYFFFLNFTGIEKAISNLFKIMFPFIVGFVIAFLLNPFMMFLENKAFAKLKLKQQTKRNIAATISIIVGIIVVGALMFLIIYQVRESIESLLSNYDVYLNSFETFVEDVFQRFNLDMDEVAQITQSSEDFLSMITGTASKYAPKVLGMGFDFIATLLKILIGIIAGLYLLMDKEKFLYQCKKLNYAIFPKEIAIYIARFMHKLRNIFYDFIVGKAIDSFIIGIICYVGMTLLGFEYAALISVIVAITNMIPVFGPFIGAVPGVFILLIVNPLHSLYFIIFIFVLQQFDGNFLGPLILGDKLGIPSFWILFSVTVGGALFGIVGMFIGVPSFAAIYFLVKEFVDYRLAKKKIDL